MILISFAGCLVRINFDAHTVETEFADGLTCNASPIDSEGYRDTAEILGYGSDTWKMCWEHELAHTLLANAKGLPYSPTLWDVAHGIENKPYHWEEENRVMEWQREVNERRRARHSQD